MVHKVTIVPRGQAGGYAVMLPREDRYFQTNLNFSIKLSVFWADALPRKLSSAKSARGLTMTSSGQRTLPEEW
ncbi:ATP-dependent zinc metalloprotease FtsH [Bacillus amyloliquefaciens]|nr:ATP-dependent zinc metalloprotease FtsH [Bacillus amyloliquefaciens]